MTNQRLADPRPSLGRRDFLRSTVALIGGALLLPHVPKRIYSFAKDLRVPGVEGVFSGGGDGIFFEYDSSDGRCWRAVRENGELIERTAAAPDENGFYRMEIFSEAKFNVKPVANSVRFPDSAKPFHYTFGPFAL